MLVGDAFLFENLQQTTAEADLAVHEILLDNDVAEVVRTRDAYDRTGDDAAGLLDHRARLGGMIGVADVDRDSRLDRGNDRIVIEDAEARVGKLAHLAIGHRGNALAILHLGDDARIARIDRVDIGEVLVDVGTDSGRENRTGDVAAAARESRDLAFAGIAEETRINDDAVEVREGLGKLDVAVWIERRVAELALENHARVLGTRIARLASARLEGDGDEFGIVILTGRLHEVHELGGSKRSGLREAPLEILLNRPHDVLAKLKLRRDLGITLDHRTVLAIGVLALKRDFRKRDQQIGYLGVTTVPLAGRGNHHNAPRRVREDDIDDLV